MRRPWLTTTLAALLLATAPAASAEPPSIEYAYPDQSVWTTRLDARGLPANPLLEVAQALFGRAGLTWHAHPYPATRMFETLRNGTANFSMLVKSSALEQCCLVGPTPIAGTELRVYHIAATPPVHRREDLRGRNVIVVRGYSYGGLLSKLTAPGSGVTIHSAVSHQAAFTMLEHGRADYLLDYSGPAHEILAERPGTTLLHETLDRLDVYLVLWRGYPDAEATLARLQAIADQLNPNELPGHFRD